MVTEVMEKRMDGALNILDRVNFVHDDPLVLASIDPQNDRRPGWLLTGSGGKDLKVRGLVTCRRERGIPWVQGSGGRTAQGTNSPRRHPSEQAHGHATGTNKAGYTPCAPGMGPPQTWG